MQDIHGVTIDSGETTSSEANVSSQVVTGIEFPSSWDSGTVTFQARNKHTDDWTTLYDIAGTAVSSVSAASRTVWLDPAWTLPAEYLRVVAPTQSADRVVYLHLRRAW